MLSINLCESKGVARIYGQHYNPHHQGAVKVFNRNVQNFFTSAKDDKKEKYNIKNQLMTFWYTRTIGSILLRRWLLSEQSWIMRIKIWFRRSKRKRLK